MEGKKDILLLKMDKKVPLKFSLFEGTFCIDKSYVLR